jgi:ATP-dependent helicase HrpA
MTTESFKERLAAVERLLPAAMVRERLSARSGLARLRRIAPAEASDLRELERIGHLLSRSAARRVRRAERLPATASPDHLPITARRDEIVAAIRRHPVLVVSGDTGSGKSTQLPKFCLAAGRGVGGLIGHTQPRRIAAQTVARRIAEELGEPLGRSIGYKIRFQDTTPEEAYVKVMTDGILLAEAVGDRMLSAYDTLIVDEAHERNLNIDFILGYLRMLVHRRRDLRVVVTSATIDTAKFSRAFDDAPVIEVSGRTYPVEVRYEPPEGGGAEAEATPVEQAAAAVRRLCRERRAGDTLVFMPTEQDIRETCEAVAADAPAGTQVLPLFARLTAAEQGRVFRPAPAGVSRVIVATNVAETSVTIPGITTVVDTGLARIPRYSPRTRTTAMPVVPVSRSSADQRKGRCGRTAAGLCVRLYSEEDYLARPEFTPPEVLRANLAEVILRMVALDLGDPAEFPFIDRPEPRSIADGFRLLVELGAVAERAGDEPASRGRRSGAAPVELTETGRLMARIPLDPRLARMLIEARREGCLREMSVIAAALSLPDPRERPAERTAEADRAHAAFRQPHSDFLTLLALWDRFQEAKSGQPGAGAARRFCRRNFLAFKRMREWEDVHRQITEVLAECGMALRRAEPPGAAPDYGRIHRSILSGFLANIAVKKEKNLFRAAKDREAMIFPGSGLFNAAGAWVVAAEMVETSRLFARTVATFDPAWLEPLAGGLCRSTCRDPRWDARRGEVVATEQVTLFGLIVVPGRAVAYGPIRPEEAADIFVRAALVDDETGRAFPFLRHNRETIARVEAMEDRLRRRDLRVSDEDLAAFYRRRLPGVYDVRTLAHLIKTRGGDGFLRMTEADVTASRPDDAELALFPRTLKAGRQALPLQYRFDPGAVEDGVTLRVPLAHAAQVPAQSVEWLVPGLLREKVGALLRGLPKPLRRRLVPLNETVDTILRDMPRQAGAFLTALAEFIHRRYGVDIPAAAWPVDSLPEHLKMRIAITAADGRELAVGRSAAILNAVSAGPAAIPAEARRRWERKGVTRWDFGDLPETVGSRPGEGARWAAYPALRAAGDAVDLILFAAPGPAAEAHPQGVAALTALQLAKDIKFLRRSVALPEETHPAARPFGGVRRIEEELVQRVVLDLFRATPRSQGAFEAHVAACAPRILPAGRELLYAVLPVLAACAQARRDLEPLARARGLPAALHAGMAAELADLVPPHFVSLYDRPRLVHLERYLQALSLRARRAAVDPEKDLAKAAGPQAYTSRLKAMLAGLGPSTSAEKRAAMEELFWTIEEYKVSVFAQELRTAVPVSPKRLDERIRAIERMA